MNNNLSIKATLLISALTATTTYASNFSEVIITATRTPTPISDVNGSWSSLDANTLSAIDPIHIQQALERLPGVNLHRNNGQEYLPAIRSPVLSGPGACGSFLMAEDGIPLRPAGFCNINELFESHFEQASRIEVARGAGMTLYGSNAMHGVINVISPASINGHQEIAVDAGPNNYQRFRTHLSTNQAALSFTANHDGGYRDDSGVDQQKLSMKYRNKLDNLIVTTGFTAVNLNQETAGYVVGKDSYKDRSFAEQNPNPEAYRDAWGVRLWSRFENDSDNPDWVLTPYFRSSQMAFLQHFLPGRPTEENGQRSFGLQSAFYSYGDQYKLITGVDLEIADGWLKQYQENPTTGSPFLQATIPAGSHYDYQVDTRQIAPFTQLQWQLTTKMQATLGLRYEWISYDYNNHMLNGRTRDDGSNCGFGGCRYSRPADRDDQFSNWSPSIALQYQLSDEQTLSLKLARGFRAPQVVELYRLQRDQQVADLDSEHLDSIDIALKGKTANSSYEVVAYIMQKDNVIFRDSDFFTVSNGETRHVGIESSFSTKIANNLSVSLSATYARHTYDYRQILSDINIDGNDVDSAPRFFGSAQLNWQPVEQLNVELDWQHMGKYYTDPENLHRYNGHDLLHLRTKWQLNKHLQLTVNLLNVFDKDYAKRADFTTFGGDRYFPGEPRSLYAGVRWQW